MNRRSALKIIAVGAATPMLAGLPTGRLLALGRETHTRLQDAGELRVLTSTQRATIRAAIDCILPETDTPSATGVGVDRFVDLIVAEWYSEDERRRFLEGVDRLDGDVRAEGRETFAAQDSRQQVERLRSLDAAALHQPEHWFGMLKHLTVWGYFTSEAGASQELAKHEREGMWQGCASPQHSDRKP